MNPEGYEQLLEDLRKRNARLRAALRVYCSVEIVWAIEHDLPPYDKPPYLELDEEPSPLDGD